MLNTHSWNLVEFDLLAKRRVCTLFKNMFFNNNDDAKKRWHTHQFGWVLSENSINTSDTQQTSQAHAFPDYTIICERLFMLEIDLQAYQGEAKYTLPACGMKP